MRTRFPRTPHPLVLLGAACLALVACNRSLETSDEGDLGGSTRDLRPSFPADTVDLAEATDLWDDCPGPNLCGDCARGCFEVGYGPPTSPFPLSSDPNRDPHFESTGVTSDVNGWLRLESLHSVFNFLWIPNTHDLNDAGTVSKVDSKTVREVARYLSVTCNSLKLGSSAACDGTAGCCSLDDEDRYQARLARRPEPGHQAVQLVGNLPSRTAVDENGDLIVANEAPGGQGSLSRIASDLAECIDRNKNGRIDSSSDVNGNGFIEVDCNGDSQPDDIASVKAMPCQNGLKQEFYGLDDECVLWTTNVLRPAARLRALDAGYNPGTGATRAVVGSRGGAFRGVDVSSGLTTFDLSLPGDCTANGTGPNGAVIDAYGIAWVPQQGAGKLCYFDAIKGTFSGVVREPQWGPMAAGGVALDRDQNVWVGDEVARYTPDRSNGKVNLGSGWWTRFAPLRGAGIVADSRNAQDYFVYSCTQSGVVQIPASGLKPAKMDQQFNDPGWPVIRMPCLAVEWDTNQNIWGVDGALSTRALINNAGGITQPTVNGKPMGNNKCPAGDSCPNAGAEANSHFAARSPTGFRRPTGTYRLLVPGCRDAGGSAVDTQWVSVVWDADVPPNTQLRLTAKTSDADNFLDPAWASALRSPEFLVSPADLTNVLPGNWTLDGPSGVHDGWLWLELYFTTNAANATPRLKSLAVGYRCPK